MNALTAKYLSSGEISIEPLAVRAPEPEEIQVKGIACGVCSWDIATCRQGNRFRFPAPPGHEGIGVVTQVGSRVTTFKVGDKVACGGFCTFGNYPVATTHKLPESTIPDVFWLVEPLSCVISAMDVCPVRTGERVVLIGCGYMGLLFMQLLAHSPASDVVGVDLDASRLKLAKEYGMTDTYNLNDFDLDALTEDLKKYGADLVIDTSGTQAGLDLASRILRPGGRLSLFGWIKGDEAKFDPSLWHMGGFSVINTSPTAKIRDTFPAAIESIDTKRVDMSRLVTHIVPLDEFPSLMSHILSGDTSYIKGVVTL